MSAWLKCGKRYILRHETQTVSIGSVCCPDSFSFIIYCKLKIKNVQVQTLFTVLIRYRFRCRRQYLPFHLDRFRIFTLCGLIKWINHYVFSHILFGQVYSMFDFSIFETIVIENFNCDWKNPTKTELIRCRKKFNASIRVIFQFRTWILNFCTIFSVQSYDCWIYTE